MSIIKTIEKNKKTIIYVTFIIIFVFLGIRGLNSYYNKEEIIKEKQYQSDNQDNVKVEVPEQTNDDLVKYSTETKSIPKTIEAFVNYCNNKDYRKRYSYLFDNIIW